MTRIVPSPLVLVASLALVASALPTTDALGKGGQAPGPRLTSSRTLLRSDGSGPATTIQVTLAAPARVRLRVTDFEGRTVRVLFEGDRGPGTLERRWRGRDRAGRRVTAGAYRVEVDATPMDTGDAGAATAEAWVTVARRPVHPLDPGSIRVVVDPGHGGSYDGAVASDGTREADINLDIGLRLARMLEGAGVDVILTRDTDREANVPPADRTFDGVIDVTDDLAARADIANAARADLFIAIHNNFAVDRTTGGPSTFYSDERTFRGRSARLARDIQDRMVVALGAAAGGDWRPHDHGSLVYPYYVLRDYDPPRLLRPTRMPAVLSEGLFLSNPRELRLLQRGRVRQAMANAYYEAIAAYLARRGGHVGYALVGAPAVAAAGAPVELSIEVRDQGTTVLRGWRLTVGAKPVASAWTGGPGPGRRLGGRRLPSLARGERRVVRLTIPAPARPGLWVLLVDALDHTGSRASRSGSPMLEVPLIVVPPLRSWHRP